MEQQANALGGEYSRPASFGDVRTFSVYVSTGKYASLDRIESAGWHKVNQKYHMQRPEGADDPLILFTVAGRGRIAVDSAAFESGPGQVAFLPAKTPCEYGPGGGELWEFYWIHFSGRHALDVFADLVRTAGLCAEFPAQAIRPLLERCITTRFTARGGELLASMLLNQILSDLLLEFCSKEKEHGIVDELLLYLGADSTSEVSMEELEKRFHYSKEHMIRAFHRQMGTTPHRYWREIKFAQAKQMLALTDYTLEQIAGLSGYSSAECFSKQFKQRCGVTPNQYRKNNENFKKEEN